MQLKLEFKEEKTSKNYSYDNIRQKWIPLVAQVVVLVNPIIVGSVTHGASKFSVPIYLQIMILLYTTHLLQATGFPKILGYYGKFELQLAGSSESFVSPSNQFGY